MSKRTPLWVLMVLATIIITILTTTTTATTPPTSPHPLSIISRPRQQYAVWIWNVWNIMEYRLPEYGSSLVKVNDDEWEFIFKEGFTDIYVYPDPDIFDIISLKRLAQFCNEKEIGLHILESGKYTHREDHEDHQRWINLKSFIQSYYNDLDTQPQDKPKEEFYLRGIHFDVEPFWDLDWPSEENGGVGDIELFQTFHLNALAFSHSLGLVYGTDNSDGFEYIDYDNVYGKGLLSRWFVETVDFLVLMSYRYDPQLVINVVEAEFTSGVGSLSTPTTNPQGADCSHHVTENKIHPYPYWGSRYRRENGCAGVMYSLETIDVTWPGLPGVIVSFFGKTRPELNRALWIVADAYRGSDGGGFAVHTIQAFNILSGADSVPYTPGTATDFNGGDAGEYRDGNGAVRRFEGQGGPDRPVVDPSDESDSNNAYYPITFGLLNSSLSLWCILNIAVFV